ncbi:MAG: hypothetical protein E6H07_13435 [Bacteroidetes bacterium]|nr:MAG: hypothetical protein E6H07_13435 [Bacteroidota bacterium]
MKILLTILNLFPLWIFAQSLAGVWTGYIKTPGSQLPYELAISENNEKTSGYSLIIYDKEGFDNIGIKTAKITVGKKEIRVEDGELIYENFNTVAIRTKLYGFLTIQKKDTVWTLSGIFKTRSIDFRDTRNYNGEVYLQKSSKATSPKILSSLDELNLLHNLAFTRTREKKSVSEKNIVAPLKINERKIEKIREIFFSADSLKLSIVDNGTVDGDTISMVLNGKMIAEKKGLTTKAFSITIPARIGKGDSLILVMHAESLGTIPPNTGLLIIEDGTTRYDIRFEGDLKRSAAIILRKK